MIIALEGIDASGKETQAKKLHAEAIRRGYQAEVIDFPHYDTPTGKLIKAMLRNEWTCKWWQEHPMGYHQQMAKEEQAMVLQCLYHANRHEQSDRMLEYKDSPTKLLICDRFWLSGLVYGGAEGLDRAWYLSIAAANIQPDRWFLIDISVEESIRRRPEREDYYEKNADLLRAVRGAYIDAFITLAECIPESSFYTVNGDRPADAVHRDITGALFGEPVVGQTSIT